MWWLASYCVEFAIMYAIVLVSINLHTKFKVASFTHYTDMIEAPKFKS